MNGTSGEERKGGDLKKIANSSSKRASLASALRDLSEKPFASALSSARFRSSVSARA